MLMDERTEVDGERAERGERGGLPSRDSVGGEGCPQGKSIGKQNKNIKQNKTKTSCYSWCFTSGTLRNQRDTEAGMVAQWARPKLATGSSSYCPTFFSLFLAHFLISFERHNNREGEPKRERKIFPLLGHYLNGVKD